ncbi:MAG: ATP-binding cassette domain-containing protein [Rhodospirillales bacterium]|nr:ATP-binding cassette domain-containing protein [Rhodospirillales bacterium]MBO6788728.1 ATP-binding cassette domain-containing protein [Rhodospirillales bacterium]
MSTIRKKIRKTSWPGLINALSATRGQLSHLLCFSFAINLLVLSVPVFMIQVFDRVLASHSFETLTALAIGAVAALLVMSALDLVRGRILARAALKLEDSVGEDLLTKNRQARLGDVSRLRQFIAGPVMVTLLDAPWIPVFLFVVFLLHPMLGWIATGGAAMLGLLALAGERWIRSLVIETREAEREAAKIAGTLAHDDGSAAVFGLDTHLGARWKKEQSKTARQRLRLADRTYTIGVTARFIRLAMQITLMAAAAALVISSQITPGAMVAASVIAARALGPFERAQDAWRTIVEVRATLARLLKTEVSAPETVNGFPPAEVPNLDVRNVTMVTEDARETIFSNVSFKAKGGEMIGITGPSGSGKTLLARLLVGLDTPVHGRVDLDHNDIRNVTLDRARNDIAYLSQTPALLPGTIADNISRFSDPGAPEIYNAARFVGAEEAILDLPYGYMTEVGPGTPPLPQGLAQKILMARTIFADPRLIVLDEPYTFLDNAGIERLISTLTHYRDSGSIIVAISQRPSVLAQCDRVVVFENKTARVVDRLHKQPLRLMDGKEETVTTARAPRKRKAANSGVTTAAE